MKGPLLYWSTASIPELQQVAEPHRGRVARLRLLDALTGSTPIITTAMGLVLIGAFLVRAELRASLGDATWKLLITGALALLFVVHHQLAYRALRRDLRFALERADEMDTEHDAPAEREPWGIWWVLRLIAPPAQQDVEDYEEACVRARRSPRLAVMVLAGPLALSGLVFAMVAPWNAPSWGELLFGPHLFFAAAAWLVPLPLSLLGWTSCVREEYVIRCSERAREADLAVGGSE